MTRIEIINLIREAISLAGDGGPDPFTQKERKIMNDFLDELENE